MNRYDIYQDDDDVRVDEMDDGEWCKWEDVEAMLAGIRETCEVDGKNPTARRIVSILDGTFKLG